MKKIIIIYVYKFFSFLYASSLEFYENSYAVIGNKFDFNQPINSYGLGITDDDFRDSHSTFTFILYRTAESNNGNWGVEIMWNYFFDQLEESDIDFILP